MINQLFNRLSRYKPQPFLAAALFVLSAGLTVTACGGKKSNSAAEPGVAANVANPPASPAANAVNPADAPAAQEKARVAQAVAMRSGVAPPAPAMTLHGGEEATPEVLQAYNQRLAQLIFERRDAPETIEELTRKWPMPKLPVAPRGKQIVYDSRNRIILLYPP